MKTVPETVNRTRNREMETVPESRIHTRNRKPYPQSRWRKVGRWRCSPFTPVRIL
ncbi:hypothetical protein T484DRAFT_1959469 [Baffinella frigidus]|nr:hypothetical protein T484DRAFT_1959469 [Cryptophyta sp. CCMP2293]